MHTTRTPSRLIRAAVAACARVADVSEIIHGDNVCRLTFLCVSGDVHPTDAGYRRIAGHGDDR
jgi:hypothetical protein